MAEILEGPKEWSRDVRCEHEDCKASFRVKKEDVKRRRVGSSDDLRETIYYAACPACYTLVTLENLPPAAYPSCS